MSNNVEILEQPEKCFRFRYESEKRKNVSIVGALSSTGSRTFPKILVRNFAGPVCILISCVTDSPPHRPHYHKVLSTDDSNANTISICGAYKTESTINESGIIEFKDIGIEFVKRVNIIESLTERRNKKINPYNTDWNHMKATKTIDPNIIRLCFQVFGFNNNIVTLVGTALSDPIYNKKVGGALKIVEMTPISASVIGGEKIILLCDRVKRDDIAVRIYEENDRKQVTWAETLSHNELLVHHQYSILFGIPQYKDNSVTTPRQCFIQLYRPSDGETSAPVPFELTPLEIKQEEEEADDLLEQINTCDLNLESFDHETFEQMMSGMESMSIDLSKNAIQN